MISNVRLRALASTFTALLLLACVAGSVRAQGGTTPEISFTVSMSKPYTHLLEVSMQVRAAARLPQQINLVMPVWAPGSYLIREFERHVQDFAAADTGARSLPW